MCSLRPPQTKSQPDSQLKQKPGIVVCTCGPSYVESIGKRIIVLSQLGKNERLYLKNKVKKGWECGLSGIVPD
jgi:hypothetical protein